MAPKPLAYIDVWDVGTFDPELIALLQSKCDLIREYMVIDHQITLSHDLGYGRAESILRPHNPHASAFYRLKEAVGEEMECRTIRAFHYTRLTDREVDALRHEGIHLSTPETLRTRLNARVADGDLTAEIADALYAASPFHSSQLGARSNKLWMVSHPTAVDDRGVTPLLAHWGGEAASMWMKDPDLLDRLAALGKPRIVEFAIPIAVTRHGYSAGEAVVAAFGRSLGCIPSKHAFDLYITKPLPPEAILAVHSEDEAGFANMARGYPDGFVDVDVGRWKELTGEDD